MSEFLKCDADGCNHVEASEPFTQEMVGKPCPLCGASLLTQEDFDGWQTHVAPLTALFDALKHLAPGAVEAGAMASVIHLHEGRLTFIAEPVGKDEAPNDAP